MLDKQVPVRVRRCLFGFGAALWGTASCAGSAAVEDEELAIGRDYVTSQAFRRDALEQSLVETANGYARLRLERYALDEGWDALPELEPWSAPLVYEGGVRREPELEAVWTSHVEWTRQALLELGQRAFERWPTQPMPSLELALSERDEPALHSALGLWRDDSGWLGGLVTVQYPSGATALAASCATCHARTDANGKLTHGPASSIDVPRNAGAAGDDPAGWGPGKLDVTADGVDNPVAIADLRATAHQQRLHWSGNLDNSLAALAVRIETLLITNSGERTRPPRQIAFALALYVQSLAADAPDELTPPQTHPGKRIFEVACQTCHSGARGAGQWVSVAEVGGDPAAAHSPMRGTGGYRVPALHQITNRTHWTHEGFRGSLDDFFAPARLEVYSGHPFGSELSPSERAQLLDYLATL